MPNALFCKSRVFEAAEQKETKLPELLCCAHFISLVNFFVVLYFRWDFYQSFHLVVGPVVSIRYWNPFVFILPSSRTCPSSDRFHLFLP